MNIWIPILILIFFALAARILFCKSFPVLNFSVGKKREILMFEFSFCVLLGSSSRRIAQSHFDTVHLMLQYQIQSSGYR